MASTAILRAIVTADTAAASGKLATVGRQIDTLGGKGASSMNRLQTAGKLAFAALGAGAIAFGVSSVKAFQESQKVMAQTEAVLRSTGQAAGLTAKDVTGLASSLSKMSGIDDEAVQSMENVLLTFTNIKNVAGKGNDIFNQTTAVVLDLSVALHKDLQSSALLVGKALQDPVGQLTALRKAGVNVTPELRKVVTELVAVGDTVGAQKAILAELNTEFHGSAKAAGDTFAGSLGKLKTAFGNLEESIGGALIPVLQTGAKVLTTVVDAFDALPGPVKTGTLLIIALGGAMVGLGLVMNTIKSSLGGWGVNVGKSAVAMEEGAVASRGFGGALGGLAGALGPVALGLGAAAAGFFVFKGLQDAGKRTVDEVTKKLLSQADAWQELADRGTETSGGWRGISGRATVLAEASAGAEQAIYAFARQVQAARGPLIGSQLDLFKSAIAAHDYSTAMNVLRGAAVGAEGPITKLAAANLKLQASADAAKLAELGLAGGFLGIQGASLGAEAAQQQLAAAHRTVNKLEKDGKKGTADYRAAVMDLKNAQLGATTSQLGLAQAVASYIQEENGGQATQRQAIADVKAYGRENGLTKGEVNALIGQVLGLIGAYKNLPGAKKTNVSAPGLASTAGRAWDYVNALNNIPRSVDSYITAHYSSTGTPGRQGGIQFAGGGVIGAAGGAFITRGPTVIAGEGAYQTGAGKGAEMVLPMGGPGGRYVKQFIGDAVRDAGNRGGGPAIHLTQHFHGTVIGDSAEFKRSVVGAVTEAVGRRRSL